MEDEHENGSRYTQSVTNIENNTCVLENYVDVDNEGPYDITTIHIKSEFSSDPMNTVKVEEDKFVESSFSENIATIKREYDENECMDDVAMNENADELKVYVKDELEQECSAIDNIQTQLYDMHSSEIDDVIKIENEVIVKENHNDFDNTFSSCNHSDEDYQSYCNNCRMLVSILDRNITCNSDNKAVEEIPKDILEARESHGHFQVFALKTIPEGVRFGPFTGVYTSNQSWRIKGGRFVVSDEKLEFLNWMQYINPAQNILQHNLFAFQYEDNIYYRSVREILEGEELLVYFGEEYEDSLINDAEIDYIPHMEINVEDVFACTFCCLGYSSEIYLTKHKAVCPNKTEGSSLNKDITQCPHCKIYLEQWEYLEHHMTYCREKNFRHGIVSIPKDAKTGTKDSNECQRILYKSDLKDPNPIETNGKEKEKAFECFLCEYEANDKPQLDGHMQTNHFEDGKYKCTKCEYSAIRRAILKLHIVKHEEVKRFKCTQCDFATHFKHCLKRHVYTHDIVNKFKCSQCDYATNTKLFLKHHMYAHKPAKRFKCSHCDYSADQECFLENHMARHETVKRFKCAKCDYVTHTNQNLKKHAYDHERLRRFKCPHCEYAAKYESRIVRHIATHEVKQLKCLFCDYVTNDKAELKLHVGNTHEEVRKFKCSQCDYVTNTRPNLRRHAEKHQVQELLKCSKCDYVTYQKRHLKQHSATHDTEKRFRCSQCDYATHCRFSIREHADTHESVKQFKCSHCDYATNIKRKLTRHSYTHRIVKRLKCTKCKFQTNYNASLRAHVCKPPVDDESSGVDVMEKDDLMETV